MNYLEELTKILRLLPWVGLAINFAALLLSRYNAELKQQSPTYSVTTILIGVFGLMTLRPELAAPGRLILGILLTWIGVRLKIVLDEAQRSNLTGGVDLNAIILTAVWICCFVGLGVY